jgi:3-deoxy-D-manno-octulosonic-acid transferase
MNYYRNRFITFVQSIINFMRLLYSLSILTFNGLIFTASLFNEKARQWVNGRKGWRKILIEKIGVEEKIIWIHCASLGEFEQGRPIIELIKEKAPEYKILLTFFSPSGYELRKSWTGADFICYLPADTPQNALRFIEISRPSMVLFVKYEFWNNYISELYRKNIPLYLISGIFRPEQHFFKWYGGFFRNILKRFTHIFVQDNRSLDLLRSIGIKNVTVAGDTRFDRVNQIAATAMNLPVIENFRGAEKLFLAGSSWQKDEEIIAGYINSDPGKMKWVFAPHETGDSSISRLEKLFKTDVVRYSCFNEDSRNARVLIIDNVGILSSAYRYAYIAAIGGGFGKGIHNILESVCWGTPVLFGPNYNGFKEAFDLIESGAAYCYRNTEEFSLVVNMWLKDKNIYESSSNTAVEYIRQNTGSTEKIFGILFGKDINK